MVRECTEQDRERLYEYLKEEAVYNTFLLADIADFGFGQSFQTVYLDEEQGRIRGVYLCIYQNFLLYCKENEVNTEFLEQLFAMYIPDVVMGKTEQVRQVQWILMDYTLESRVLYQFSERGELAEETAGILKAKLDDVDDIFTFLQSIPELKHLYTSKEMIAGRIEQDCGTHYIIRENGVIVAHANSTAECEWTTMIGGVATARAYRGKGLAGQLVSRLSREILAKGKIPTLFSSRGEEDNLYGRIGFRKIGEWGTLARIAASAPDEEDNTEAEDARAERVQEENPQVEGVQAEDVRADDPQEENPPAECRQEKNPQVEGVQAEKTEVQYRTSKRRPSYIALYDELYRDIVEGIYKKDSLLPSENVLSEKYHVSRNTLRQALAILNQDGYIYRKQGKGTYVSYDISQKEKGRIYNFLTEDALEEIVKITIDHNLGAPTLIAKSKLELDRGEEVLASNNVYESEQGPIGQSFIQIPEKLLEEQGIDLHSEQQLLSFMNRGIYQLSSKADMMIQLMEADEQVVPYLKVKPGTVLLHFEQLLYDKNQRPAARIKYYFREGKYQIHCRL